MFHRMQHFDTSTLTRDLSRIRQSTSSQRFSSSFSIPELIHHLEITNAYVRESDTRKSGRDYLIPTERENSSSISQYEENEEIIDNKILEDDFIKQFAHRCAEYPGRKPILMEIEQVIQDDKKAQLPIILV